MGALVPLLIVPMVSMEHGGLIVRVDDWNPEALGVGNRVPVSGVCSGEYDPGVLPQITLLGERYRSVALQNDPFPSLALERGFASSWVLACSRKGRVTRRSLLQKQIPTRVEEVALPYNVLKCWGAVSRKYKLDPRVVERFIIRSSEGS